jgi:secondary thiamine-phosphate synthase enzyme
MAWCLFLRLILQLVSGFNFLHNKIDDNADSHIISGLLGQGRTLMIENCRLIRGTRQQIFLVEADGPRKRRIIVKIINEQ